MCPLFGGFKLTIIVYCSFIIECILYTSHFTGPYPPSLSVDVVYSLSRPPVINVTIIGRPRWPSYVISEFIMNITTLSNGSLLSENVMYIENNCTNNTCFLNLDADELMPTTSLSYECNTLRVAVSSVSEAYGEGEPSQKDSMILKGKIVHYSTNLTMKYKMSRDSVEPLLIMTTSDERPPSL